MDARRWLGWGLVALCTACSGAKQAVRASSEPAVGGSGLAELQDPAVQEEFDSRRYVNQELGFELTQLGEDWVVDESDQQTPEGLPTPIVLKHRTSDATMVLQVVPAVVSTVQFAERLMVGFRGQPGFVTSDPEPLPLSDSAVGFHFAAGNAIRGRVVVRDGSEGYMLMMLATWPTTAPAEVPETVNVLLESVHPLPVAPEQL